MTDHAIEPLGMTEADMYAYLDEVLQTEAAEAAEKEGTTLDKELHSREFQAVAAAATYAIKLIQANNVYVTQQLIDRGLLTSDDLPFE